MRILLTGEGGRLGRRLSRRLSASFELAYLDPRRRAVEDVFAAYRPEAVIHLGVGRDPRRLRALAHERDIADAEALLRSCAHHEVHKLVLLSSGDVYGPRSTNSHFLDEDAQLASGTESALIAVDRAVQSFFWRHTAIETVILRPCHIVGPYVRSLATEYLRLPLLPTLMGFDPMLQLVHEDDVLATIAAVLRPGVRGIFNLAGVLPLPLSAVLKATGKPTLPLPYTMLKLFLYGMRAYRATRFCAAELAHLRFNAVLDTSRAERELEVPLTRELAVLLAPFVSRF